MKIIKDIAEGLVLYISSMVFGFLMIYLFYFVFHSPQKWILRTFT